MMHVSPARGRLTALVAALAAVGGALAGCSSPQNDDSNVLKLAGPNTNIVVNIPDGWHQVIDSSNPEVPEMVTPMDCFGNNEVACSTGLARIATITAKNLEDAANSVQQAVIQAPGVTDVVDVNKGPGKVGSRDGFRHRFTFKNPGAALTAEVASVPSGPTAALPDGTVEYSVILVWVSDKAGAPKPDAIDRIIGSTLVHGGVAGP